MPKFADLHMHSTCSDGQRSPAEMVRAAAQVGLDAISLTDHDEVGGLDEAIAEGRACGVEVIPGIELSVIMDGRDIHLLGYFFDHHDLELRDFIRRFNECRLQRVHAMVRRLAELGAPLEVEAVLAKSTHGAIGRPHVAAALLEAGHVASVSEAFERFIGNDGPAYVAKYPFTPEEGVQLIHRLGGVTSLAHPGLYPDDGIVERFVTVGVDGLEIEHPKHTESQRSRFYRIAREHGLLVTGGSDCHGDRFGLQSLGGLKIPYARVEALRERAARVDTQS
ncbi:MAG: PHP domain-containing protein [Candidatus Tectomicrobia bacterium]|nr:PHP domain-containing protein [Candidatus Tectomicrobia bacterium]